jgi:hypothetical protein
MQSPLPLLALTVVLAAAAPTAIAQTAPPAQPATTAAPAEATVVLVQPDAIGALQRMGAYLGTLQNFEIHAETTRELMLDTDKKFDLDGVATYRVQRPTGLVFESRTTRKERRFYYDGQHFTVYAPTRNFYATVDAPPTIGELLNLAAERYGVELPLEDLFHWGDPANLPQDIEFAQLVGPAMIEGVQTDQYLYRRPGFDWQVWIQQGSEPLPRKIVIVDRSDPTLPKFTALLTWNTAARFDAQTFAFQPDADDKPIRFLDESE